MTEQSIGEAAKAVGRGGAGRRQFRTVRGVLCDDFLDHTRQPGGTRDKTGVRNLYHRPRAAFPDFHAEIHWQRADGDVVTTYKTYHGTHKGEFLGIAPTGRQIQFETVDAMRVTNGKITEHWGVANLFLADGATRRHVHDPPVVTFESEDL